MRTSHLHDRARLREGDRLPEAVRSADPASAPHAVARRAGPHVWIDLDNSPHVPFFEPIIEELRRHECRITLTARDAYQVTELVRLHGMHCRTVGRHYGGSKLMKVVGLGVRAAQLLPIAAADRPHLAVSHGSRAQTLVARLLHIRSVLIADYEHVTHPVHPDWAIVPEAIPTHVAGRLSKRVLKYPGLKEDVYAGRLRPDPGILQRMGIDPTKVVVTLRPPATEAHYHTARSEDMFVAAMQRLSGAEGTVTVVLPRNARQRTLIGRQWAGPLRDGRMVMPEQAVDGLNLLWQSDLVISGGGTMNREAAALGLPVYSIFGGRIGAIDQYLAATGRLMLLGVKEDVHGIPLVKRSRATDTPAADGAALKAIVDGILQALHS
jgi:uncharacterized protein